MYYNGYGVPENDAEAVKWYRKAAEQGFAKAQFNLGRMYATGEGVPVNDTESVKWFLKAAEQGDSDAQTILGQRYATGTGVLKDYVRAYMWWSLAKAQGNKGAASYLDIVKEQMIPAQISKAQNNLGGMYVKGDGVPQNDAEAVKWWRKAAEQGHAKAQNNLGVMYIRGTGVPANAAKAYMWISLSKAQGYKNAAQFMDIIKPLMTPTQIAEGKALAAEWWEKHNN